VGEKVLSYLNNSEKLKLINGKRPEVVAEGMIGKKAATMILALLLIAAPVAAWRIEDCPELEEGLMGGEVYRLYQKFNSSPGEMTAREWTCLGISFLHGPENYARWNPTTVDEEVERAMYFFEKALEKDPEYLPALKEVANVYDRASEVALDEEKELYLQKKDEALEEWSRARETKWERAGSIGKFIYDGIGWIPANPLGWADFYDKTQPLVEKYMNDPEGLTAEEYWLLAGRYDTGFYDTFDVPQNAEIQERLYLKVAEKDPEYGEVYSALSVLYWELAQYVDESYYDKCIWAHEKEVEANPDDPYAYYGLAQMYAVLGRAEEGIEVIKKGLEIASIKDRDYGELLRAKADFLYGTGRYEAAAEAYGDYRDWVREYYVTAWSDPKIEAFSIEELEKQRDYELREAEKSLKHSQAKAATPKFLRGIGRRVEGLDIHVLSYVEEHPLYAGGLAVALLSAAGLIRLKRKR
jgi:tetratricopeptide (TPR) repeat protein